MDNSFWIKLTIPILLTCDMASVRAYLQYLKTLKKYGSNYFLFYRMISQLWAWEVQIPMAFPHTILRMLTPSWTLEHVRSWEITCRWLIKKNYCLFFTLLSLLQIKLLKAFFRRWWNGVHVRAELRGTLVHLLAASKFDEFMYQISLFWYVHIPLNRPRYFLVRSHT